MILSAAPVALTYGYDNNLTLRGGIVYTFDDLNFYNTTLLGNTLDITLNKNELLALTNFSRLTDSITTQPLISPGDYVVNSLITDQTGTLYLYATNFNSTSGSTLSFTTELSAATIFNINFPSETNTIQISYVSTDSYNNSVTNYLISNGFYNPLSAGSINWVPDQSYYTFVTLASGSYVSLFNSKTAQIVALSANSLVPQTFTNYSVGSNNLTIPSECILNITRLHLDNAYGNTQTYGQSDLVQYSRLDNNLSVARSSGNAKFNYLVSAPFKTLSGGWIDTNINTLKNYYSPQHVQSTVFNVPTRYYTKLFTGLNQTEGFDKIYLSYNSNVAKINFVKDQDNYFHYPYGSVVLPLSSSTLISYGARADVTPFRSDRLVKKVADYAYYSSWGNSASGAYYPGTNTYNRKGVYFCSWLSAGANVNVLPVWVDRYYDPKQVNQYGIAYSAISALSGILVNSTNNYPNLIWDVPSTNTFEPGVLYYYHRFGDNDNETLVNSFSGLTYYIDNFGDILYNQVTGLSAGIINSFTPSNSGIDSTVKTPYYITNGTYGTINTSINDFNNNEGNTLSFFLYQDNWADLAGDQIIGNYFNGGIGVFVNNPILTPYFTVAAAPNILYTYNTELQELNYELYGTFETSATDPLSSSSFILKGLYDNSYYVIDNYSSNKFVSTFDPDGLLTNKVALTAFDSTITSEVIVNAELITKNSTNYIILKTRNNATSCCYRQFLTNGILVSSVSAANFNNFVLDFNGKPSFYNSNWLSSKSLVAVNGCVDSNNNVYTLSGGILYKNNTGILTVAYPEHINCDKNDNVWITYNKTHLAKINSNGTILWSKQINTSDSLVYDQPTNNRVINFIAELNSNNVLQYYGLVLDGKSQTVYKVDANGVLISKVAVPNLIPNGDVTGFDYQRKFVAPYVNSQGIRANIVTQDPTLTTPVPTYFTLSYNTNLLAPGWHHFAVTVSNNNVASLYVDGNIVNRSVWKSRLPSEKANLRTIYNYKNNPQITIGASNFKNSTLNEWIGLPDRYLYNGRIADIRFYNITLTRSDILALSNHYQYNQFNNFDWLIPTGLRGYIEEIERFFLHRLPGAKSQFFDIKIKNSGILAPSVQAIVENNIQTAVANIAPAYAQLRNIIWE